MVAFTLSKVKLLLEIHWMTLKFEKGLFNAGTVPRDLTHRACRRCSNVTHSKLSIGSRDGPRGLGKLATRELTRFSGSGVVVVEFWPGGVFFF